MSKKKGMLLHGAAFQACLICAFTALNMGMIPWCIFILGVATFFLLEFCSYVTKTDK